MQNVMNIMNNSYLHIDMNIFRKNMNTLLASLPAGVQLIPVLKDDAYGLGLWRMAAAATEFDAVRRVAVAHVSEGLALRQQGFEKDILVLGSALPFQLPAAVAAGLELAAGSAEFVSALDAAAAQAGRRARVHVKIDTGLHRIGAEPGDELAALAEALRRAGHIDAVGIFSHFADTDNEAASRAQYACFMQGAAQLAQTGFTGLLRHICSSASYEQYPEYALDAVRIGRALYMDSPDGVSHGIEEAVTWRSYITAVKQRRAGDSLGYGGAYRLAHDAKIATVGVGYGDGLNEALCRVHADVLIGGKRCALLACCMDQCFADVTGIDCVPGDEVTFFGHDGQGNFLPSQEVAALIGSDEGCGLTSALSPRVARIYGE